MSLSQQQIQELDKLYTEGISDSQEVIDSLFSQYQSGTLPREEYSEKLRLWEGRYFEYKGKLRDLQKLTN